MPPRFTADSMLEENEPRRREIQRRLARAVAPNLLSYYRDALQILSGAVVLENASHFVAHAMRDIESGVRRLLLALLLTVDEREQLGKQAKNTSDETQATQIRAVLAKLGVSDDDRIARIWMSLAGRGNVKALHGRAHRRDLRPAPPIDPAWWAELEELLEFQLDAIERHHTSYFPLLDRLAAKATPSAADITTVNNDIPNTYVMRRAFFELRLKQPGWLQGLREAGVFQRAPQEEADFERVGQVLPWPETDYLARMAADPIAGPTVMEIALEIESDNEYVHHDLLKAALAVTPAHAAIALAHREAKWIGSRERLWFPPTGERAVELALRLATVPDVEAPFDLARRLLEIRKAPVLEGEPPRRKLGGEAMSARLDEYEYQRAVQRITPALTSLDVVRACELLSSLLDGCLRASRSAEEIEQRDDHSTYWRRSIGSGEEGPRPYENALVSGLVDALGQLIAKAPKESEAVLAAMEARGWSIFRRIVLHLATRIGGATARTRILDPALLASDDAASEYCELVRSRFGELDEADRKHYFDLVQRGPDLAWLEAKEQATYLRPWQVRRLRLVEAYLPPTFHEAFPELATPAASVDEALERGGYIWSGRAKPEITAALLQEKEVPEAIELLRAWKPKERWGEATRSDLGNELTSAVASQPGRFAEYAPSLQGLDPVYARSFFAGLQQALKDSRPFRWAPVLGLAAWITEQDAGWQSAHREILELIEDGLAAGGSEIPFAECERVWKLIEHLERRSTTDEGLEKSEALTASLSTTRGRVVHDAILYALWVRRHIERRPGDDAPTAGFDEVQEARALLERRLDLSVDRSLATRGAFGYRLTQLTYLDAPWVRGHLEQLFPKDEEDRALRRATRDTYIAWSAPYSSVIELLADEYRDAFESASDEVPVERTAQQAEEHLPEHLAIVYLRGHFAIDHALLQEFLARAPARMRGGLLEAMGRLLSHESTEAVHLERALAFWERRRLDLQKAKRGDKEAANFGFWFILPRFPLEWRLREMHEAVQIALAAEPDGRVMETLAELAPGHPSEALAIAEVMALHPTERWQVDYWMPELRTIVAAARDSKETSVATRAKELVSKLIVSGHLGLADLA